MRMPWISEVASATQRAPVVASSIIPWLRDIKPEPQGADEPRLLNRPPTAGLYQDSIVNRAKRQLQPIYQELESALSDPKSINTKRIDAILKRMWSIQSEASVAARVAGMLAPFAPELNSKVPISKRPDPIRQLTIWPVVEAGLEWLENKILSDPKTILGVVDEEDVRAAVMGAEVDASFMEKLNRELLDSITIGESRDDWHKRMKDLVETKVGFDEVISSTAAHRAFITGQEEILEEPVLEDVFPYRQYLATMDNRIRQRHAHMNKKVFHKNSRLFDEAANLLNEYRCRCSLVTLTEEEALSIGVSNGGEPRSTPPIRFRDRVYGNPANRPMDV